MLIADDTVEYIFKDGKILRAIKEYREKILCEVRKGDYVVFYNAVYPTVFMENAIRKKMAFPVLLMADYSEPQEYKNLPRKVLAYLAKIDMGLYDRYVVLSSEFLKMISDCKPKLLLQGGVDDDILEKFREPKCDSEVLRLYYSGYLAEETGVKMLLDAFRDIDENKVELILSGRGPLVQMVQEQAKRDKRIKYFGYVSNEEYYELLNSSHVVINPRNMHLPQNRNNFPSKIMEYLASGRMIISTKFAGWEIFENNAIFIESDSTSLKVAIRDCIEQYHDNAMKYYFNNQIFADNFLWKNQSTKFQEFLRKN